MTFLITAPWGDQSANIQRTDLPKPPPVGIGPALSMMNAQRAQAEYERMTGEPYDPLKTLAGACNALRLAEEVRVAEALLDWIDTEDATAEGHE